jgi:hypothetical protein
MQPYFSALNKYIRDHHLTPVVVGDLLANARRELEMQQKRLVPSDTRLPLKAPVAILLAVDKLKDNLTWTLATLTSITHIRALLAVCVNYTFF